MNKEYFKDYATLVDRMIDVTSDGGTVYAVCFYEDAAGLLKELMSREATTIAGINLVPANYNGYKKEYYVSVDKDMIVDIEPAYYETDDKAGYLDIDYAAATFIVGDANSAILQHADKLKCIEIEFKSEEEQAYEEIAEGFIPIFKFGNVTGYLVDIDAIMKLFNGE